VFHIDVVDLDNTLMHDTFFDLTFTTSASTARATTTSAVAAAAAAALSNAFSIASDHSHTFIMTSIGFKLRCNCHLKPPQLHSQTLHCTGAQNHSRRSVGCQAYTLKPSAGTDISVAQVTTVNWRLA
jgi:hypothetical protein